MPVSDMASSTLNEMEMVSGNINETNNDNIDMDVIGWDGDDDPACPYNWPRARIVTNAAILTFLTFLIPLTSCEFGRPGPSLSPLPPFNHIMGLGSLLIPDILAIIAPGVPELMVEFDSSSNELAAFVVSVYVLGVRDTIRRSFW